MLYQLDLKRSKHEAANHPMSTPRSKVSFDVAKFIRLVIHFQERDVDK